MKISEALALIKQKEGELMRLYQSRENIASMPFDKSLVQMDKITKDELEQARNKYLGQKKERFSAVNTQIERVQAEIVDLKNKANRKNVQLGTDRKLAEIKILRVELSKLMDLVRKDRLFRDSMDLDSAEILGLSDRIKSLETKKMSMDNAVQSANWTNDL